MFCLSESDTFYLYPYPTDMRKSFYSLSGIVTNEMKRDVLYRRAVKAERRCEELSDAAAMKRRYETRIKELEAGRDKQISDMKAKHQKEISKKEDEIRSLVARLEYLTCKLWGKMSEKRQTPDDPHQLKFDFEGMDLTEEEKRQIEMFKRIGIELRQPTVEGWFFGIADLMRPLYYRLQEYMLRLGYLQSDESTVPIINNEKHRTVKGYMWLIRAGCSHAEKPHRQGHRISAGAYPPTLTLHHRWQVPD